MERYAELFGRHRGLVAAFIVALSAASLVGISRLEFDDRPRAIFESDDDEFARLESVYEQFGSDDNKVVVLLESDGWFTAERAALLRRTADAIAAVDGVRSVVGLHALTVRDVDGAVRPLLPAHDAGGDAGAFERAARDAVAHPLAGGRLISYDRTATLIVAALPEGSLGIEQVRPPCEAVRAIAREVSGEPGVRARVTGIPPIRAEIYDTIRSEQALFVAVGTLICLILATIMFRSIGAVIATLVPPLLGTLWSMGMAGLVGYRYDILAIVIPELVIVIGFTDSVHLMYQMRRSRKRGRSPLEASKSAIRHLGVPCALTSLTTAIGIASLAFGELAIVWRFALACAGSVGFAYLAVITGMPLAASFLRDVGGRDDDDERGFVGGASRLIDRMLGRSGLVAAAGAALTVAMLVASLRLVPENRLTEALPDDSEAFAALRDCETSFGGILPLYVLVEWGEEHVFPSTASLASLRGAEALLEAQELLAPATSIASIVDALPGDGDARAALLPFVPQELRRRWVRPDLSRALVAASVPDLGTAALDPMLAELHAGIARLESEHAGFDFHLTGTDVVARRNVNTMIVDLTRGLLLATLLIVAVIALEFRSLTIGLISLVPNVFPLAVVGAVLWLRDEPMQVISAILFTILLGLAVDDTIHFLARWRRELRAGADAREAAVRSFRVVGRAIFVTSVVLAAGWGAVMLSSVPTNRLFSGLIVVGLGAALVGDLVILPALLAFFRPRIRE